MIISGSAPYNRRVPYDTIRSKDKAHRKNPPLNIGYDKVCIYFDFDAKNRHAVKLGSMSAAAQGKAGNPSALLQ